MDAVELLIQARTAGLKVHAEGTMLVVHGPRSAGSLARRILAHKADVLSVLALPEEFRPLVNWAAWLAERVPAEDIEIRFHETPLRPVSVRLSDLGRYVTELLGSLSLLQSWEAADSPDMKPGWRKERINELCATLEALRQALHPFGLAQMREGSS